MLAKVLKIYFEYGNFSSRFVADKLGISEIIVDEYKKQLIRMGYLKKQDECSLEACKTCSCGCVGKKLNPIVNWNITDKGYKIIEKC